MGQQLAHIQMQAAGLLHISTAEDTVLAGTKTVLLDKGNEFKLVFQVVSITPRMREFSAVSRGTVMCRRRGSGRGGTQERRETNSVLHRLSLTILSPLPTVRSVGSPPSVPPVLYSISTFFHLSIHSSLFYSFTSLLLELSSLSVILPPSVPPFSVLLPLFFFLSQ